MICRKSDCCLVRTLATEYGADPGRFAGARRRFTQDTSHPDIVYEPGKCILCDACVRIAAAAGEPLGLAAIGRGFDVAVAAPGLAAVLKAPHSPAVKLFIFGSWMVVPPPPPPF